MLCTLYWIWKKRSKLSHLLCYLLKKNTLVIFSQNFGLCCYFHNQQLLIFLYLLTFKFQKQFFLKIKYQQSFLFVFHCYTIFTKFNHILCELSFSKLCLTPKLWAIFHCCPPSFRISGKSWDYWLNAQAYVWWTVNYWISFAAHTNLPFLLDFIILISFNTNCLAFFISYRKIFWKFQSKNYLSLIFFQKIVFFYHHTNLYFCISADFSIDDLQIEIL